MKRNEVVSKLEYEFPYIFVEKGDADMILSFIEDLGMLPPTVDCEKWIDCEGGQGFMIYVENEWEKE